MKYSCFLGLQTRGPDLAIFPGIGTGSSFRIAATPPGIEKADGRFSNIMQHEYVARCGGWSEDYQSGFTPVRGDGGVGLLKSCGVGLAGADAHRMVEAEDEDLTVADLSGFRRGTDRLDDLVHLIGRVGDFELDLR